MADDEKQASQCWSGSYRYTEKTARTIVHSWKQCELMGQFNNIYEYVCMYGMHKGLRATKTRGNEHTQQTDLGF